MRKQLTQVVLLFCSLAGSLAAAPIAISPQAGASDFPLAGPGGVADVVVDDADFKVVRIASDCLSEDINRVVGKKPRVLGSAQGVSENAVLIGTIGKSRLIDKLVKDRKLSVTEVAGKWESYVVATVTDPLPGVKRGLVIAGSDRRGTAYGAFSLSEAIGVSPWVWWADVAPAPRSTIAVKEQRTVQGPPSVKYRGIFINDEDFGLRPWAAKTLEPEKKNIGPKTYARVGELLLRLKANLLWPAMHEGTAAFFSDPANVGVADDYGIVVGSSHAEPMLYNNASEWTLPKDHWNYVTHADEVKAAWEKRVQGLGKYEYAYTLGIRGIHDSPMQGGGTMTERKERIERVFADQRELIARHVNPKVEQVPQVFVPYKEVLPYYQNGLKVPDDVTLVWVDDNFGYIRQLSTPEEQKRRGGAGVYYHHSYWGDPADYLWIGTSPLSLTWEEMHKAYENGARNYWVVNVGDIKPMEIGTEFFLKMAYDITAFDENAQPLFLKQWATREFGEADAVEVASIMDEYYRVNQQSKPEHLYLVKFSNNYGEIEARRQRLAGLVKRANALYEKLPAARKDPFFEMVLYQVRGTALAFDMNWSGDFNGAMKAYDQLQKETTTFNEKIAGGKWRYMMPSAPRNRPALRKPEEKNIQERAVAAAASGPEDKTSVAFEAEQPLRREEGKGTSWKVISGLGRSGDSIALLPTTVAPAGASLTYEFTTVKDGPGKVRVDCIPTFPLNRTVKLRYAAAIDGGSEQEVDLSAKVNGGEWATNVVSQITVGVSDHMIAKPGKHTLVLRPLDPGVVFDKVVVDLGDLKPSQLGPVVIIPNKRD
ncbi:glycosyl hydrolase 115 family protein [Luteolibacter sp. LG18]|uniref:glycosyl hydrolase 115 family protein n=1 Tax=Luteolibacter sp. LG18 TaxID=2819286 RepID=UPI002B2EDF2C|nr:hypothetical protein llg_41600 [Luteolibacter sp. LG18]